VNLATSAMVFTPLRSSVSWVYALMLIGTRDATCDVLCAVTMMSCVGTSVWAFCAVAPVCTSPVEGPGSTDFPLGAGTGAAFSAGGLAGSVADCPLADAALMTATSDAPHRSGSAKFMRLRQAAI